MARLFALFIAALIFCIKVMLSAKRSNSITDAEIQSRRLRNYQRQAHPELDDIRTHPMTVAALPRTDMDDLIDVCVKHMANEEHPEEEVRSYLQETLPKLDYWKRYKELGVDGAFEEFKKLLITEINELNIEGMPKLQKLNALVGGYVNLEYRLPNGKTVKYLDDNTTYLGNQLECEFGGDRCFGIVANMDFILICTYEKNGENPEIVIYKKR